MSNKAIEITDLTFVYSPKTPYEKTAIENVSLTINEGEFLGIIGHTGSGKSTFIQHINGLIKAQTGKISVFDVVLTTKKPKPNLRKLRGEVGMVFQYPEYQLFDETVARDVAFGPKNLKLSKTEIAERVREAITLVGLDYESIKDRSPFDLSGGQKRRVAIAGVIAMRPKVLILDEPTAGLDPIGKEQILGLIMSLKAKHCPTIIVISHDIDEISRYADRIVVFNEAKILYDQPMTKIFCDQQGMQDIGLDIPTAVKIKNRLAESGIKLSGEIITPLELMRAVVSYANAKGGSLDISALPNSEIALFDSVEPVDDVDYFKEA